ncbi:hypothetical protein [Acinetobacter sp. CAAS 2-6]|uniref:hypothetical protein n=1 Tax=Acinetobacter sp. CAAS 2-6 TaxID=3016358 RepID=UPI002DD682F7|nr:hypothetical protein [Acinetobacter sp. CAAS 2-6]
MMRTYRVTLAAYANGDGTHRTIVVSAYSEFHACQVAQNSYPGWFAMSAEIY